MLAGARQGDPAPMSCNHPTELAAVSSHSVAVSCGGPGSGPVRGPARLLFGLPIDPNRADAETLEVLPGIGPSRAGAIVAGRESRPYRSVEDLQRVSGIGPVTVDRLARWVAVAEGS